MPNRRRIFLVFTLLIITTVFIVLSLYSFFGIRLFPILETLLGRAATMTAFILYLGLLRAMFPTRNIVYNFALSAVLLICSFAFGFFFTGFFFETRTDEYTRTFLFWLLSTFVQLLSTGAIIKGFIYLKVKFFAQK